jgi:hypothetical protein
MVVQTRRSQAGDTQANPLKEVAKPPPPRSIKKPSSRSSTSPTSSSLLPPNFSFLQTLELIIYLLLSIWSTSNTLKHTPPQYPLISLFLHYYDQTLPKPQGSMMFLVSSVSTYLLFERVLLTFVLESPWVLRRMMDRTYQLKEMYVKILFDTIVK